MTELKTSNAQVRATKKYDAKNPEQKRYRTYKATAKGFLTKNIKDEDLEQFIGYLENLKKRKKTLDNI